MTLRFQREARILVGAGDSGAPIYQKRGRSSARAVGIQSAGLGAPIFTGTIPQNQQVPVYGSLRYSHIRRFERKAQALVCTPRRC